MAPLELDKGNSKQYKIEAICDTKVYSHEVEDHLLDLYYFVLWKGYQKEKNTWEPTLVVQYLWRFVTIFHKKHLKKPTATSSPTNSAPPIAIFMIISRAKASNIKQK